MLKCCTLTISPWSVETLRTIEDPHTRNELPPRERELLIPSAPPPPPPPPLPPPGDEADDADESAARVGSEAPWCVLLVPLGLVVFRHAFRERSKVGEEGREADKSGRGECYGSVGGSDLANLAGLYQCREVGHEQVGPTHNPTQY